MATTARPTRSATPREAQRRRLEPWRRCGTRGRPGSSRPGGRARLVVPRGRGRRRVDRPLAGRTGGAGRRPATDLDTTVLAESAAPNLEVRAHDVLTDDLPRRRIRPRPPAAGARVGRRPGAQDVSVAALRPGGVLVAEEMDFASVAPDPRVDPGARAAFERYLDGHHALLRDRHAFDRFYGRRVAGDLASVLGGHPLKGRVGMWRGGGAGGLLWRLSLDQLRDGLLEGGYAAAADLDVGRRRSRRPRLQLHVQVTRGRLGTAARGVSVSPGPRRVRAHSEDPGRL